MVVMIRPRQRKQQKKPSQIRMDLLPNQAKTKSVPMVIMQTVDNSEMTEDQIYQLLREMEVVDEEGEFVWEENMDVEPNPICQDEFLQTNEGV